MTLPPRLFVALAVMSLFSSAAKTSVSIVILPPVVVPVALVLMLLPLRNTTSGERSRILPCPSMGSGLRLVVSAVIEALLFRSIELAVISKSPAFPVP